MDGSRPLEATLAGDVKNLLERLQADVQNNFGFSSRENQLVLPQALHIAALHGHADFVRKHQSGGSDSAYKVDSQGFLPLHLASARGHLETVKELLKIDSRMCLALDKGTNGWIPLHLAARHGRADVLKELVVTKPSSAVVLSGSGETALHLCVKHKHFDALKVLVELAGDASVVNMKDAEDNTILHLAVATKQVKMVEYLVASSKVDVNALNANGLTALDMLLQDSDGQTHKTLVKILEQVGAKRGNENYQPGKCRADKLTEWLYEKRSMIMAVAVLIAAATFQAGLNNPWWSILSSQALIMYRMFMSINPVGFLASRLISLLLVRRFQLQRKSMMWVFTVVMWVTVSSLEATNICVMIVLGLLVAGKLSA